jgi:3-oxoacyl-[acyl-carrier-protein] synthase III
MHRPVYWLGSATALPEQRVSWVELQNQEQERLARQLGVLSPGLRERVLSGLGIETVGVHEGPPSALALEATRAALTAAGLDGAQIRLVIDYSTLAGDYPAIWSLAHGVADGIRADEALPLNVHGAGCAGLLLALRTALALLRSEPELSPALLVAADCVPKGGRSCLPVSVMGDAASAVVLSTELGPKRTAPRVLSVTTSALSVHHRIIVGRGSPPVPEVDGAAFESRVLPVHFLMLHRVLTRALTAAGRPMPALTHLVYPNTSLLDREGVSRALGVPAERLSGPGPKRVGHAFANDLVYNFPVLSARPDQPPCVALLAVGSGFTWGAGIVG